MSPKTAEKSKASVPKKAKANSKTQASGESKTGLNKLLRGRIAQISKLHGISEGVLEEFAHFVIENHRKKDLEIKPLTLTQLKSAVYNYFGVKTTTELKHSGSFKMATDGMDSLNLSIKEAWEKLYRKFIGTLPNEVKQDGYGCINSINIFDYFKPWQVFGLDPQTATEEDVKNAYHALSKIYHPDIPTTGDARVFDRINTMYKSITARA